MSQVNLINLRSRLRDGAALFVLGVASVAAAPATAQTAGPDITASEQETIIVTGSRIARPELSFPNPVVGVSAEKLEQSGTTNVTDFLTEMPALVGSLGSGDNSGSSAGIGFTGLNLLDLRNLGYDRTLVLVDGRRHVAAIEGSQAVDINTLPSDLIERVDILTGGASAIYGADGVSGVVNFVLKKNFEGITARAQAGISQHGDAGQRLFAITAGHNFAGGKGNFAIAWEHGEEDRLESKQRKRLRGSNATGFYLNADDTETGDQNNDGIPDRIPLKDVRYFDTAREGGIDVGNPVLDDDGNPVLDGLGNPVYAFDYMPDYLGTGGLFDPGVYVPSFYQQGGSATLVSDYANDLLPRIRRDVINGLAHYEFSDAFEVYAEGKYAKTRSFSLGQPTFDYYLHIPEDNPYIPESIRSAIRPELGEVWVSRDNFDLGQRGEDIRRETIRTVLGARGEIAPNLRYDVSYVFGQTKVTNHYIGDILDDRFYAAIDAVAGPNGPTCRVNIDPTWTPNQPDNYTREEYAPTTFTPGSCIPFNLFGNTNSQAAIDWLRINTTDRSKIRQQVLSGAITGDTGAWLNLPGGPVGFAVGGEYRKETSSFTPDPIAAQGLTFTNALGSTRGNFDVKEFFGELRLPLLKDAPFAYRLEVGGAVRFSDYSTIGKTTAWKVDGTWSPIRDITFRGTYSTAVRAPNIGELFGAQSQTFEFISDPCDINYLQNGTQYRAANCQALLTSLGVADPSSFEDTRSVNILGTQGGNPALSEEKAKTWTAGVVLQPSFLRGFTLTADWYNIRISKAINQVTAEKVAELCVDQATLDNQFCDAITRNDGGPNAGFIDAFVVGPLNVAAFTTAGLDVSLNYVFRTDRAGTFSVNVVGNYLDKQSYVPIPGADPVNDAYTGGTADGDTISPKYQAKVDLTWKKGALTFNYGLSWWSKTYRYDRQTIASNPDIVAPEYLKYKERWVQDVFLSYDFDERLQLYTGIDNIGNQKPAIGSSAYPVSSVGRFFYVGAKVKLADAF